MQLLTKLDKAVSTNDVLLDLQRALTYEAVFSSLVEHKMQALKRDYEEHKRAKRKKRKSIGRILLPRKLFGARRSSKDDSEEDEEVVPLQLNTFVTPRLPSATAMTLRWRPVRCLLIVSRWRVWIQRLRTAWPAR